MTQTPPAQPHPAAVAPADPIPYAVRPATNGPALASLVWGLMLFLPFASGVLAIRYARKGRRRAEELRGAGSGMARAGFVLGVINLALSVTAAVAFLPLAAHARRQSRIVQCMSQLRQIGMAVQMYAANNRGFLPPDMDTLDRSMAVKAVCTCPAAASHRAPPAAVTPRLGNLSYVYVVPAGVRTIAQVTRPASEVLAYEPPANHGGRGMNVLYWDGHVEFITVGPAMQTIQAQIATAEQAAKASAPATPAAAPPAPPAAGPE